LQRNCGGKWLWWLWHATVVADGSGDGGGISTPRQWRRRRQQRTAAAATASVHSS